jgi:hypothetical protein
MGFCLPCLGGDRGVPANTPFEGDQAADKSDIVCRLIALVLEWNQTSQAESRPQNTDTQ